MTTNSEWLHIDWTDVYNQLSDIVLKMRNKWIQMTKDKLCNKADITFASILRARKMNKMRIKTINKLKKIWIFVKILEMPIENW